MLFKAKRSASLFFVAILLIFPKGADAFLSGFGGFIEFILCLLTFNLLPFCNDEPPTEPAVTRNPTPSPTRNPTPSPTGNPTPSPTKNPTPAPTGNPTPAPTENPTPPPVVTPTPPVPAEYQIDATSFIPASFSVAFETQLRRWEEVIIGDQSDIDTVAAGIAGDSLGDIRNDPDFDECIIPDFIDDHWICVVDAAIDGVGGTIGFASTVFTRTSNGLTVVSLSKFDSADLEVLSATEFNDLVLHEVGHTVSVVATTGSLSCPSDAFANAPLANAKFQEMSGCDFLIPTLGNGDRPGCFHWDFDCFNGQPFGGEAEIMVSFLVNNALLSEITVAYLDDVGYEVNYEAADPFPEFGTTCRCTGVETVPTVEQVARPQLSEAGMQAAEAYGRGILTSFAASTERMGNLSPDIMFAPNVVEVYYMEDGIIYPIEVQLE